jgi:hypothetical protein
MLNHTPGPWKTSTKKDRVYVLAQNEPICEMLRQNEHTPCAKNAFLIAAAPDMLDALEAIMGMKGDAESDDHLIRIMARNAIKKARGE